MPMTGEAKGLIRLAQKNGGYYKGLFFCSPSWGINRGNIAKRFISILPINVSSG